MTLQLFYTNQTFCIQPWNSNLFYIQSLVKYTFLTVDITYAQECMTISEGCSIYVIQTHLYIL